MDSEAYYQQLQAINQMLEDCPEGSERSELLSLKQNIEELLSLTKEVETVVSPEEDETLLTTSANKQENEKIDDEYALFMAEMAKEGAVEASDDNLTNKNQDEKAVSQSNKSLRNLEGQKFRAPHKHQWGQVVYHNAMVCSVPDETPTTGDFQVKVLFLNPTHKEMQPCPYYFHLERDCHFTEDSCGFSHGESVSFSCLQEYVEPKFELLTIGSDVLAMQSNSLWYRAKITAIFKTKCLVKFESKNVEKQLFEELPFAHILPMETSEKDSENDSDNDDVMEEDFEVQLEKHRQELINRSLMDAPESQKLGDWEKYTKGIGSRLMQKMGYIVGTGLGKKGSGIVKPVTALILPQGKSLDYCMNLKEKHNNPDLFSAEQGATKRPKKESKKKSKRLERKTQRRRAKVQQRIENMNVAKFIHLRFFTSKVNWMQTKEEEYQILRDKLKSDADKDINTANFMIEEKMKKFTESIEDLKTTIKRLDEVHADTHKLLQKLADRQSLFKTIKTYKLMIKNEIDRRKNNKEMAVF